MRGFMGIGAALVHLAASIGAPSPIEIQRHRKKTTYINKLNKLQASDEDLYGKPTGKRAKRRNKHG